VRTYVIISTLYFSWEITQISTLGHSAKDKIRFLGRNSKLALQFLSRIYGDEKNSAYGDVKKFSWWLYTRVFKNFVVSELI